MQLCAFGSAQLGFECAIIMMMKLGIRSRHSQQAVRQQPECSANNNVIMGMQPQQLDILHVLIDVVLLVCNIQYVDLTGQNEQIFGYLLFIMHILGKRIMLNR